MRKITIKKGRHLSNQLTGIHLMSTGVRFEVMFTEESKYILEGEDQYDWNKLYGISHGFFPLVKSYMMHYNSSRFGWRYNTDFNCYEVTPYYYINGERYFHNNVIGVLDPNRVYICEITPWYDKVVYSITDKESGASILNFESPEKITSYHGFIAPAYFGGNMPAPKDVSYLFERL
jgi:hypothetical protein